MRALLLGLALVPAVLVWWMYLMAKDARRVHERKADNCVHYVAARDWRGDPEPAVGTCPQPECIVRRNR